MARIAGVDLAPNKRVEIALRYIYGIGPKNVHRVLELAGIAEGVIVKSLTESQVSAINGVLSKDVKVEGDLRRDVDGNIRRYIEIGCYKGQRHRKNLPVRGQRTKTNARTRRGTRRTVGSVKPGVIKSAPAAAAPAK